MLETIAFISLFWSAPEPAAVRCPPAARSVSAEAARPGYVLDHSLGRADLARMAPPSAFSGFATQGLTRSDLAASFRMEMSLTELADGTWCADAEAVAIEHGLTEPAQVYVAREIERGSCLFETVLQHEREHVAIAERAAASGAADAVREVRAAFAARFPVSAPSRDGAYALAAGEVDAAVARAAERAAARAELENAAIDTAESYAALSMACR